MVYWFLAKATGCLFQWDHSAQLLQENAPLTRLEARNWRWKSRKKRNKRMSEPIIAQTISAPREVEAEGSQVWCWPGPYMQRHWPKRGKEGGKQTNKQEKTSTRNARLTHIKIWIMLVAESMRLLWNNTNEKLWWQQDYFYSSAMISGLCSLLRLETWMIMVVNL